MVRSRFVSAPPSNRISEITYFQDNPARAAAGQFLKVPMMMGTTTNEEDVFTVAQELVEVGHVIPVLSELMSDIVTTVSLLSCFFSPLNVLRCRGFVPSERRH